MSIFKTYVLRIQRKNKLRTIMTIAGIILSVALVTAVIEGAFSGLEYLRNVLKDTYGNHHGYSYNMTSETAKELISNNEIDSFTTFDTLGWADIGSSNSTKPYLLVKEGSNDISDYLRIEIQEGHFPENENEILIPEHLAINGNVHYKIGDSITLSFGVRYKNGLIPENTRFTEGETLLPQDIPVTKTFTVCGIMSRLPYTIEEYMCPGYTAITLKSTQSSVSKTPASYKGEEIPEYNIFFRVTNPAKYNEFHDNFEKSHPGVMLVKNRELLALYGGAGSKSIMMFLNGFVAVLIGLILFGSISLVFNSFSISINERTKQIGILKSVGATKKQIRKTIFYEALFDSVISIPLGILLGCAGIGMTLFLLQEGFTMLLSYNGYGYGMNNVKIGLVLNPGLLIIAIIIVLITVFLSAAIPALRASKVSPIDLVRQNSDIKATGKIRKSKILSRIFGAEGMLASKNYSRNKKRYRSTIISLAVSIILFIAASSFCSYLSMVTDSELESGTVSLIYYDYYDTSAAGDTSDEAAANNAKAHSNIKEMLESANDVNKVISVNELYDYTLTDPESTFGISENESIPVPATEYSTEFPESYDVSPDIYPASNENAGVYFIDDKSFYELIKDEGIEETKNESGELNSIIFNNGSYYSYDKDNNRKKYEYQFVNEEDLPKKLNLEWYNDLSDPEKMPINQLIDSKGEIYTVFFPTDKLDSYYSLLTDEYRYNTVENEINKAFSEFLNEPVKLKDIPEGNGEQKPLTEEDIKLIRLCTFVRRSELCHNIKINIIGTTNNEDYRFSQMACILIPISSMPEIMRTELFSTPDYYIYSNNSKASEESINHLLIDNNLDTGSLYNVDASYAGRRMISKIVNVFSYGFILLISLVAIANVFNTISTNVTLRRREFAILKSIGLSNKGVSKILNIECLIYGTKSLLLGLPLSIPVTYALYRITNRALSVTFSIPWYSIVIATGSVFIVVFITMLYASGKIKKDNTMDALRNENI